MQWRRDAAAAAAGKGFQLPRCPLRRHGATPKPSRAKKRRTEGRLHLLNWAQTCTPPIPFFVRVSPPENYPLALRSSRLLLSPSSHLVSFPFVIPGRSLPPWNEVGMCKIVPRCALHHQVASFRTFFFSLSLSSDPLYLSLHFILHLPRFLSIVDFSEFFFSIFSPCLSLLSLLFPSYLFSIVFLIFTSCFYFFPLLFFFQYFWKSLVILNLRCFSIPRSILMLHSLSVICKTRELCEMFRYVRI